MLNSNVNSRALTFTVAAVYIVSGVSQPMLMTLCKYAGLADHSAQLYMFFYYFGPATLVFTLWNDASCHDMPSRRAVLKACGISLWDMVAQACNYTGASMAGSTLFAVIYSSITIWTAIWSRILLGRSLTPQQWMAILIVMLGLSLTALESSEFGPDVKQGAILVLMGSSMHGGSYVFSETMMNPLSKDKLSVRQNTAVQATTATVLLGTWQVLYTWPHMEATLIEPTQAAGTTIAAALFLLLAFAFANLIHSWAFYHTLKHYPGGATSAGMMKGLQAVLVMVVTHIFYCGRLGGGEMCFSVLKFISLVAVVTGVVLFGLATETIEETEAALHGYSKVDSALDEDNRVDSILTVSTAYSEGTVEAQPYSLYV